MPDHRTLRPLRSAMSMETLESLDDQTLARIGMWRDNRPKPFMLGATLERFLRSGKNSTRAAMRRRMLR